MDDVLLSASVNNTTEVCISPLSRSAVEESGIENLGDDFGYFIYEVDHTREHAGINILAKAASFEAAMRLAEIYVAGSRLIERAA